MLKRLNIYCKEMYPILPRLGLGYLIAGEIYFIVLLNHGVVWSDIWPSICARHGIQELILGFTVFSFLFWLRIADDFKDYGSQNCLVPVIVPTHSMHSVTPLPLQVRVLPSVLLPSPPSPCLPLISKRSRLRWPVPDRL